MKKTCNALIMLWLCVACIAFAGDPWTYKVSEGAGQYLGTSRAPMPSGKGEISVIRKAEPLTLEDTGISLELGALYYEGLGGSRGIVQPYEGMIKSIKVDGKPLELVSTAIGDGGSLKTKALGDVRVLFYNAFCYLLLTEDQLALITEGSPKHNTGASSSNAAPKQEGQLSPFARELRALKDLEPTARDSKLADLINKDRGSLSESDREELTRGICAVFSQENATIEEKVKVLTYISKTDFPKLPSQEQEAIAECIELCAKDSEPAIRQNASRLAGNLPVYESKDSSVVAKVVKAISLLLLDKNINVQNDAALNLAKFGKAGAPALENLASAIKQEQSSEEPNQIFLTNLLHTKNVIEGQVVAESIRKGKGDEVTYTGLVYDENGKRKGFPFIIAQFGGSSGLSGDMKNRLLVFTQEKRPPDAITVAVGVSKNNGELQSYCIQGKAEVSQFFFIDSNHMVYSSGSTSIAKEGPYLELRFTVRDNSKAPISAANISVQQSSGESKTAKTDANGKCVVSLESVKGSPINVVISKAGTTLETRAITPYVRGAAPRVVFCPVIIE